MYNVHTHKSGAESPAHTVSKCSLGRTQFIPTNEVQGFPSSISSLIALIVNIMYMSAVFGVLKQAELTLQESFVSQHLFCTKELMCPLDFDRYLIRIFFFLCSTWALFGANKTALTGLLLLLFSKAVKRQRSPVKHHSAEDLRAVPAPQ